MTLRFLDRRNQIEGADFIVKCQRPRREISKFANLEVICLVRMRYENAKNLHAQNSDI